MSEKDAVIKKVVLKFSLENAINHNGQANEKSVLQKIMATNPDLRKEAKKIELFVEEIVQKVNSFSKEKQVEELKKIAPELLEKKGPQKREHDLPPLKNGLIGKVVTRYAPEPNGEMHIGHAFTAFFARYYADKYEGKFILRFEDTNPKQEKIEYMNAQREDLKWLDLLPDKEVIVSNDIPIFYDKAKELIRKNLAYTCNCPVDELRDLRAQMKPCSHANKTSDEVMTDWENMVKGSFEPGQMVLRLRGNMADKNAVMRDPAIFTIRKEPHCIQGRKYNAWPLYDFAVAIEDFICGITHVARSFEFDTRTELQNTIREYLGLLPQPNIFHYARFNVIGCPASKRLINPLVKEGKVEGWDDIRLVTIKGLRRRGIVPETIKRIALEIGMSTQPLKIDWSLISATNRKIVDPTTNRYFFVPTPIVLYVKGTAGKTCKIPLHPDNHDKGVRELKTNNLFFISKDDLDSFKKNDEFRLKDLFNVKLTVKNANLSTREEIVSNNPEKKELLSNFKKHAICEYLSDELKPIPKIQWVVAHPKEFIPIKVKVPGLLFIGDDYNKNSLTFIEGVGEKAIKELPLGELVQFERFGFIRIDKKEKDKIHVNFTHK